MKIPTKSTTGAGTIADADGENTDTEPAGPISADDSAAATKAGAADPAADRSRRATPRWRGGMAGAIVPPDPSQDATSGRTAEPAGAASAWAAGSRRAVVAARGVGKDLGAVRDAAAPATSRGWAAGLPPRMAEGWGDPERDSDDDGADPEDPAEPLLSASAEGMASVAAPTPSATASAPTRPTLNVMPASGAGRTPAPRVLNATLKDTSPPSRTGLFGGVCHEVAFPRSF